MSGWVSRRRTLMVGASCLLHLGLIAGVLLAEQWILSAHASRPPVLPIELVTPADSPPPEPPPMKAEPPKPKPVPPRPLRLPKPIETPLPQISETVSEPPPPAEARPEPPAPAAPAPTAPAPAAPAVAAARPSIPADSDPGRPGPTVSAPVQSTAPPGAIDGTPLGRPAPSAPAGPRGRLSPEPRRRIDRHDHTTRAAAGRLPGAPRLSPIGSAARHPGHHLAQSSCAHRRPCRRRHRSGDRRSSRPRPGRRGRGPPLALRPGAARQ